ncbi:hypothetical protein BGP75_11810 [Motiliproteus sp. MSK22-1]|nr:hypothetical protein BGP75_11810 [Motiliproteus sp. MSK22-1]
MNKGKQHEDAVPQKESQRESEVLALIRRDPLISQNEIGERLGISRSAVAGHIMKLMQKGVVRGKGYLLNDEPYVVVIGGANMDIQGTSQQSLVEGDSNPGSVVQTPGGVGRNIAENLARLGVDVRLIVALGRDRNGEQLLQQTEMAGVDCSPSFHFNGCSSSYLSVMNQQGELVAAVSDMAIVDNLTPECLSQRSSLINNASALVLDTNLPAATLEFLLREYSHIPIFVDPVSTAKAGKVRRQLSSIHTLKPNRLEAEQLTGIKIRSSKDFPAVTDFLHRVGIADVYLSLGADGVFASRSDSKLHLPALSSLVTEEKAGSNPAAHSPLALKSVTGAGDAFMAGLVYSHLKKMEWVKGVGFAQACAQMTLTSERSIHPALCVTQVEKFVDLNLSE